MIAPMRAVLVVARVMVVLLLLVAALSLLALSGEYPGTTRAGMRVAALDVLPLAALAWVHLGLLENGEAPRRVWIVVTVVADVALLVRDAHYLWTGAPPLVFAVPVLVALLLISSVVIAWNQLGCERRRDSI